MKSKIRILSALAACVMAVSSIASLSVSATLNGDANNDGSLDLTDVILINRYVSGTVAVENPALLDFDGDHIVCVVDATKLNRYLVNLSY